MPAPNVGTMIRSWDDRKGATAAMTLEAARRAYERGAAGPAPPLDGERRQLPGRAFPTGCGQPGPEAAGTAVDLRGGGRSDAALRRAGRYGDGYTGIWQSVERMQQAAALIDEAARPAGGAEMGMQFWAGVADDRGAARELLARAMQGTYRIPFERFEKYTTYGPAGEIAEFLAPYIEAGARRVNLVLTQPTPEENIERAAEIRQALHALVA